MSNLNVENSFVMPEFAIDTVVTDKGKEIPGIKRMYDIALAIKDSLMQWGAPGVGKSQAVQQWNAEKVKEYERRIANGEKVKPWNPHVCDVRLSMKEPVDMIGIPTIKLEVKDGKDTTSTVWATPSMWPKDDGEFSGGVIHLDEMNQGQAAILNAAFQLIQDRALGEYKVPEGYIIIASSNPSAYNSTVTELSIPLSNRFSHFNIRPDFDSWLNYRMNNGGNLQVMSFLKTQGTGLLFDKTRMEAKVGKLKDTLFTDVAITPRSWEVIEALMDLPLGTKETGGFTMAEKQAYASGRLGLAVAAQFFNYVKDSDKYQNWQDILVKGNPFRDESADQYWAVQMSCMQAIIQEKDDAKCREYVLNFLKATRELNSKPFKIINVTNLVKCERLRGKFNIFNPLQDAPEEIKLATISLKN